MYSELKQVEIKINNLRRQLSLLVESKDHNFIDPEIMKATIELESLLKEYDKIIKQNQSH